MVINFEWIFAIILIFILTSIQYTLNRMFVQLKEIVRILNDMNTKAR